MTTSFVVHLILSVTITLNIRRCITSAIAKHSLIKQEKNSKAEGRKAVEKLCRLTETRAS